VSKNSIGVESTTNRKEGEWRSGKRGKKKGQEGLREKQLRESPVKRSPRKMVLEQVLLKENGGGTRARGRRRGATKE